jgi:hypothetical protein
MGCSSRAQRAEIKPKHLIRVMPAEGIRDEAAAFRHPVWNGGFFFWALPPILPASSSSAAA